MNCKTPVGAIAAACARRARLLEADGAELIVVLIDREDSPTCPPRLASEIERELAGHIATSAKVVVKDSMLENWLLADLAALRASPARYEVTQATARSIEPNRADNAPALRVIKRCVRTGSYEKVRDAQIILKAADPMRIAAHSRSFRRFLRVVGEPTYAAQSKRPL
jgi:hypothetical protein